MLFTILWFYKVILYIHFTNTTDSGTIQDKEKTLDPHTIVSSWTPQESLYYFLSSLPFSILFFSRVHLPVSRPEAELLHRACTQHLGPIHSDTLYILSTSVSSVWV